MNGLETKNRQTEPAPPITFSKFGRDALVLGLNDLKLTHQDKIAVPAYICSSALEVAEAHGYKFHFFDIPSTLIITLDQILDLISKENIKALILVHYFGKIQPYRQQIRKMCRLNGIMLIEDHCHSALSYLDMPNKEGSPTEISILSFRKCIRMGAGGGAIKSQNGKLAQYRRNAVKLLDISHLLDLTCSIERMIYQISWPNPYSKAFARVRLLASKLTKGRQQRPLTASKPEIMEPPAAVLPLLNYPEMRSAISSKRRTNYEALSNVLLKQRFVLAQKIAIAQDTPQIAPVLDSTKTLVNFLRQNGVGAYNWPGSELPKRVVDNRNLFPIATELASTIVCLPIHQDINEKHIRRMEYLLKLWQQNNSV